MSEQVEAIREEIVRQKKYSRTMSDNAISSNMRNFFDGADDMCNQLLNFIDSLPEEPKYLGTLISEAQIVAKRLIDHQNFYQSLPKELQNKHTDIEWRKILEFIATYVPPDSQPEEQPSKGLDVTDFCKPIDPGIAQCIADNWWEMLGEDEQPSKDLEAEIAAWIPAHLKGDVDKDIMDAVKRWGENVARHFYKLGLKARKEE